VVKVALSDLIIWKFSNKTRNKKLTYVRTLTPLISIKTILHEDHLGVGCTKPYKLSLLLGFAKYMTKIAKHTTTIVTEEKRVLLNTRRFKKKVITNFYSSKVSFYNGFLTQITVVLFYFKHYLKKQDLISGMVNKMGQFQNMMLATNVLLVILDFWGSDYRA